MLELGRLIILAEEVFLGSFLLSGLYLPHVQIVNEAAKIRYRSGSQFDCGGTTFHQLFVHVC
jgi:pyruvate/2-oxoglutarate/acetoin dehydrogenase E1 component